MEFGPHDALAHRFVDLSFDMRAIYSTHLTNYTSKPKHIIPPIQPLADKITTSLARKLRKSSQTCIVHTANAIDIYSAVYVFISVYNFNGPIGGRVWLLLSVAPLPQALKLKLRCGVQQNKP